MFSSVQSLSRVQLSATPWIAACQASLSITNSQSPLKLTSIKSVMPSSHLILCHPLLLPPTPPSINLKLLFTNLIAVIILMLFWNRSKDKIKQLCQGFRIMIFGVSKKETIIKPKKWKKLNLNLIKGFRPTDKILEVRMEKQTTPGRSNQPC